MTAHVDNLLTELKCYGWVIESRARIAYVVYQCLGKYIVCKMAFVVAEEKLEVIQFEFAYQTRYVLTEESETYISNWAHQGGLDVEFCSQDATFILYVSIEAGEMKLDQFNLDHLEHYTLLMSMSFSEFLTGFEKLSRQRLYKSKQRRITGAELLRLVLMEYPQYPN